MSRFAVLARHPRRTLASLAALLAAAALVAGSGAVFSSQTSNPTNTFAAGILSQSNSKANSAVLTASQIIPGSSTSHESSGTVVIQNTGTVGGVFTLAETGLVDQDSSDGATGNGTTRTTSKLSDQLQLVIQDCGAWTSNSTVAPTCPADSDTTTGRKYAGALSGVGSSLALSSYAVSEKHTYKYLVWLPDGGTPSSPAATSVGGSGDNAYSGSYSSATFQFNSTSS
jgi:hypothetical protein